MSIHIDEILDYLDAHPIGCHEGGVDSLMEMLHDAYVEYNAIDNEEIHRIFQRIGSVLENLSVSAAEDINTLICSLCVEHEVLAFSHGVVVGMHLMTEVNYLR